MRYKTRKGTESLGRVVRIVTSRYKSQENSSHICLVQKSSKWQRPAPQSQLSGEFDYNYFIFITNNV